MRSETRNLYDRHIGLALFWVSELHDRHFEFLTPVIITWLLYDVTPSAYLLWFLISKMEASCRSCVTSCASWDICCWSFTWTPTWVTHFQSHRMVSDVTDTISVLPDLVNAGHLSKLRCFPQFIHSPYTGVMQDFRLHRTVRVSAKSIFLTSRLYWNGRELFAMKSWRLRSRWMTAKSIDAFTRSLRS